MRYEFVVLVTNNVQYPINNDDAGTLIFTFLIITRRRVIGKPVRFTVDIMKRKRSIDYVIILDRVMTINLSDRSIKTRHIYINGRNYSLKLLSYP